MANFREQYKTYRDRARASLVKNGLIDDPDTRRKLSEAIEFKGVCEDMCPEYEKVLRITEHDVKMAEKNPHSSFAQTDIMVKKLARSAAGQEAPLPMDVRSVPCIRRTLDYLLDDLMKTEQNLPSTHGFLWDRTRAIRRDFAFFSSMTKDEMLDQIYCLETLTRFHVTALHILSRPGVAPEDFSEQQEVEQLGKALLSLIYAYDDCRNQGISCKNEPEFRAYYLVLRAFDTNILDVLESEWNIPTLIDSPIIQTALSILQSLKTPRDVRGPIRPGVGSITAPFCGFFDIIAGPTVSFTMACFAEIHFGRYRRAVLRGLNKAFARPRGHAKDVKADGINRHLRFDTVDECIEFVELHGLTFTPEAADAAVAGERVLVAQYGQDLDHPRLKNAFSRTMVDKKRGSYPLPYVIRNAVYDTSMPSTADCSKISELDPSSKLALFSGSSIIPPTRPLINKAAVLDGFTRWYTLGDDGLLQQFYLYMTEEIVRQTFEEFVAEEERRREEAEAAEDLAKAIKLRTYNISIRYLNRWRVIARERRLEALRRSGRDQLRAYHEAQRKERRKAEAALKRKTEMEAVESDKVRMFHQVAEKSKQNLMRINCSLGMSDYDYNQDSIPREDDVGSVWSVPDAPSAREEPRPKKTKHKAKGPTSMSTHPAPAAQRSESVASTFSAGGKTQSIMEQYALSRSASLRRSMPGSSFSSSQFARSQFSTPPAESPDKRISKVSDRWRLKAMGLTTMPDGSILPDHLAQQVLYQKKRYSELGPCGLGPASRQRRVSAAAADLDFDMRISRAKALLPTTPRSRSGPGISATASPGKATRVSSTRAIDALMADAHHRKRSADEALGLTEVDIDSSDNSMFDQQRKLEHKEPMSATKRILLEAQKMREELRNMREEIKEGADWLHDEASRLQSPTPGRPPSELLAVHGLLRIRSDTFLHHPIQHAIFGAVTFLGCAEKLAATVNTVAVERDWVVALTHNDAHARTQLNRRMRQIDLFCKLLGPLVIALIDSADTRAAISVACGMSLVSAGPEYVFIEQIYNCVPALQRLSPNGTEGEETPDSASWNLGGARNAAWVALVRPLRTLPEYVRHPAFQPSFALALLYLTVLSFSGQMVAFLRAAGFSSAQIGAARVVSSLFELSATVMAPRLVEAIGPVRAGIWALSWQTVWLGIGLSCFFWHIGNQSSEILSGGVVGLVGGVMVSRVGLWGYDFAAQTIIQDEVDEFQRGSFSAMEASIQNLFELLAFATTAIFHRPEQFRIPTLISFGAVATASLLYAGPGGRGYVWGV
ncbi:SAC3 family protein 1 [Ceratocystis platani]|uniref:SAC3 family protein 1 n=1 Tax=Ceratocystis fimbriata f. sp. platani TaxID=88771 RepID=A0A0F8D936_CERFI|nr:SAC3 family protein 1 [Ceratocystis platani]